MKLHLDIESFSRCELKNAGLYRYAEDPSTEALCLAYAFDDGPVQLWTPGKPLPGALVDHIRLGGEIRAHNAAFERAVLNGPAGRRIGFPHIRIEQCVCTAAKVAAHGLPRALKDAAKCLGSYPKDEAGQNDMRYLTRPRSDGSQPRPEEEPDRFRNMYSYCVDDVKAERDIDRLVPDLSPNEQWVYELDQRINDRGVGIDLPSVENALYLVEAYKKELLAKCVAWIGVRPSQTAELAKWIRENGYPQLTDLQAATVREVVEDPTCPENVKRVLRLYSTHNMKAVSKYEAMRRAVCADGRLRGMFLYYGANTGRWCLTGDHEVMTPLGWQRLDEWLGGSILCWDQATSKMDFARSSPNAFEHSGDLIVWDTERFQQVATPEHRMPVEGVVGGVAVQDVNAKTARIPRTGLSPCSSRYSEAQLRFLVMAQADGHFSNGAWKFAFTKTRKEARCRALLKWLGLVFNYNSYPNDASGKTRYVFTIHLSNNRKDEWWLCALGPDKTFPWELLYADHDVFFEELREWDSYQAGPHSIQYCTTVRQNADFVQAKAHMAKRQCLITVKQRSGENEVKWVDAYYCSIWSSDKPAGARSAKKKEKRVAHNGYVYCPSTPTGFFLVRRNGCCWITGNSSSIVQLQNLYRSVIANEERPGENEATAIEAMRLRDLGWFRDLFSGVDPMKALASCVRGMVVPTTGKVLQAADFSAIEARVLAWLAGQEDVLQVFRTHGKIYEHSAARMFRVPMEQVTKSQRFRGKVAVLALGYQGGKSAFAKMAKNLGVEITEDEAEQYKVEWRAANPRIEQFWYDIERTAIAAVENPGRVFALAQRRIMFKVLDRWLYMRLPSGRRLAYFRPEIDSDGQLTYYGIDTYTRRWCRCKTYGGRLCLAEGTLVLTATGWQPIEKCSAETVLWDGEEWAYSGGLVAQGVRPVIEYAGVDMTPDHEVLTNGGWKTAAVAQGEGHHWQKVCIPDRSPVFAQREWKDILAASLPLRQRDHSSGRVSNTDARPVSQVVRLHDERNTCGESENARKDQASGFCCVAQHAGSVSAANASGVAQLRSERDYRLQAVADLRDFLGGHGSFIQGRADVGPNRQRQRVLSGELSLDDVPRSGEQYEEKQKDTDAVGLAYSRGGVTPIRGEAQYDIRAYQSSVAQKRVAQTYDLVDAGPRRRFVVRGAAGQVLIVHNCENAVQASSRDLLAGAMLRLEEAGHTLIGTVHDEAITEVPEGSHPLAEAERIMCELPAWAAGLPVRAEGFRVRRYRK